MARHPERIGRYEILRLLGRGAMGMVYLAQDPMLKRSVAIKVVQEHGEDQEMTLLRFQREAEISARLNHPNIVTVFDVGRDPAEGPFMAMEYVEGSSLAQLVPLDIPMDLKLHILAQVMGALQAAADEGIVHRDVKPENILVRKDGRAKLMDFGIARREESHLTAKGMFFGTPSYTAPELVVGGDASPATDRYAFAVTAFELVSGAVPFTGSSLGSTLYRIVHDPPALPPDMPPPMTGPFLKALAKKPEDRHPDLASFMQELIEAAALPPEVHQHLMSLVAEHRPFSGTGSLAALEDPSRLASTDAETVISGLQLTLSPEATRPSTTGPNPLSEDTEPGLEEGSAFWEPLPEPDPAGDPAEDPGPEVDAAEDGEPERPAPEPEPAPGETATAVPGPSRRVVLLLAAGVLLAGLGAAGWWRFSRQGPFTVEIRSTPGDAEVLLEGRPVGHTPLEGLRLPAAGGTLTFRLAGYESETRRVARGDSPVLVRLRREPYRLAVVTDPEGAEVLLNGTPMGVTPLADLPVRFEGRQELRLRKAGYQEWSAILDPEAPFPALVRLSPN